jgi:hypothetical protein
MRRYLLPTALLIVVAGSVYVLVPNVRKFLAKDACLDAGGSYNDATQRCDYTVDAMSSVNPDSVWAVRHAERAFLDASPGYPFPLVVREYWREGPHHLVTFDPVCSDCIGGAGTVRVWPNGSAKVVGREQ